MDRKLPLIAVPILLALLFVGGLVYFHTRRRTPSQAGSTDGAVAASVGSNDTSTWSPPQSALERIRSLRWHKFGVGPPPSISDGGSSSRWTPLPPLPSGGMRPADDPGWASTHFARARSSSVAYSTSQSLRDLPATPRSGPLRRDASAGDLSIHRQREFRRATQILAAYESEAGPAATTADGSPDENDSRVGIFDRADDGSDSVSISSYEIICLPSSVFALPLVAPSPSTPTFPPMSSPSFSPDASSCYGLRPLTPASSCFGGGDGGGSFESAAFGASDLPVPVSPRALMRSSAESGVRLERSTTFTEEIALVVRPTRRYNSDAVQHSITLDQTPTDGTITSASRPSSALASVRNVLGLSIVVNGHRHAAPASIAAGTAEERRSTQAQTSAGTRPSDVVC